jgi:hypothetical protein
VLLGAPAAARAVPQVDVSVSSVTFPGSVMVGLGSNEHMFRVSSVGSDPLRLHKWKLQGAHPADFTVAGCGFFQPPPHPMDLQPGEWCPVQVGFRPTAPGPRSAELVIDLSDPLRPQVVIPLNGHAIAGAPDLQVGVTALAFGMQPLGGWSAPRFMDLVNVGSSPLTVSSIDVADHQSFKVTHSCSVLPPATSCRVEVEFWPRLLTLHQSLLTIASDDPQGVVEVALSGTGGAPHLDVASPLDFGGVFTGSQSFPRDVVIRNITAPGMGHLHVSGTSLIGPQAADFRVASMGTCGDVPEGGSCALTVVYAPRGGSGPSSATLLIRSDSDGVPGLVSGVQLLGSSQFLPSAPAPPVPGVSPAFRDVQFVAPGSPTTCAAQGTSASVLVNVTRAFASVTPGPPSTPQPTVASAILAGTMAPMAKVEMMVFHQGPASQHQIALNFPPIPSGAIVPTPGVWSLQSLDVPVDRIGFPTTAAGSTPTRSNPIFVTPDPGGAGSCVAVAWARITIKAASPVILIHGDGSDGAFFNRQGLTAALSAAGIPSHSAVNLAGGGSASVAANAATLQTLLPPIVRSFGVNSVHLVTHSKGGLDARQWLSTNAASNAAGPGGFRVLSLTTLGTPHRGSPLADLEVATVGGAMVGGVPLGSLALFGLSPGGRSILDLTTFAGLGFNPPLPTGADYQMIAGDADTDSDLMIRSAPVDEYAPARSEQAMLASLFASDPPAADALVTDVYRFLRGTAVVVALPVPVVPGVTGLLPLPIPGPTMPNDLLVRSDSALGAPAPFVPAPRSVVPFDHAGIAGPSVGADLVPLVIATDTLRGDLR